MRDFHFPLGLLENNSDLNYLPKTDANGNLVNSSISDNGTLVTVAEPMQIQSIKTETGTGLNMFLDNGTLKLVSDFVQTTTNQTISGQKTFNDLMTVNNRLDVNTTNEGIRLKGSGLGISNTAWMSFYDSANVRQGYIGYSSPSNSELYQVNDYYGIVQQMGVPYTNAKGNYLISNYDGDVTYRVRNTLNAVNSKATLNLSVVGNEFYIKNYADATSTPKRTDFNSAVSGSYITFSPSNTTSCILQSNGSITSPTMPTSPVGLASRTFWLDLADGNTVKMT